MEQYEIDEFLDTHGDYLFPNSVYTREEIESALRLAPEDLAYSLNNIKFNNPTVILILSVVGSTFALDRFFLKKIVTGILKVITLNAFGIWTVIDVITARKRCRNYNCSLLIDTISDPSKAGEGIGLDLNIDTEKVKNVARVAAPELKKLRRSMKELGNSLDATPDYRNY